MWMKTSIRMAPGILLTAGEPVRNPVQQAPRDRKASRVLPDYKDLRGKQGRLGRRGSQVRWDCQERLACRDPRERRVSQERMGCLAGI
jgi:hypothetical protein